jgi:hypothetical protein
MATTDVVDRGGKLGVYWETYGFRAADSVEIAVWIERSTGQSIVRRFGVALGVATDLNTPVSISWQEPQPGYRSHVSSDGGVMIIGRSVIVDVSQVAPGEYSLEIAVRKRGGEAVRGRTVFTVAE